MTLYISIKTPDRTLEQSSIDDAITFMAAQVAMEKREGRLPASGPVLDVTFLLSTTTDEPPFSGMRMGGYNDDSNTLYFETAVPETVSNSPLTTRYVAAVLQDVVDNAAQFFGSRDIPFDNGHWTRAMEYLAGLERGVQH